MKKALKLLDLISVKKLITKQDWQNIMSVMLFMCSAQEVKIVKKGNI